jgi:hypothetical protein
MLHQNHHPDPLAVDSCIETANQFDNRLMPTKE